MDFANLLNERMRANPRWRKLAEAVEDILNASVGAATDEAINANGTPLRFLRGDVVDPRSFKEVTVVSDVGGPTLPQLIENRERAANVRVVLPTSEDAMGQIYMDLDGVTYVATDRRYHSRSLLIKEAKQLGFDFFSDDLTDNDYARINMFISEYWPRSGSAEAFGKFLGFIRDMRIDLNQLWTTEDGTDEYNVMERYTSSITPVWKNGKYYPTFHYDMYYDAFKDTDPAELKRLFFAMAPIHLVLRRMIETIRSIAKGYASGGPTLSLSEALIHRPQTPSPSWHIKYTYTINTINMPMMLISPNLNPNGIAVSASGPGSIIMLERDPAIANPGDPVQYMIDHGLYVASSFDPLDRFDFPSNGIWNSGIWFMAQVPGTGLLIEIT